MHTYNDNKEWLTRVIDLLYSHFGSDVEFVVHDLTLDYEHTIADIRNGHITNREVGGTGDILGLEVIRGTVSDENTFFNCINYTQDGRTLRSSTLFLYDENGKPTVCIGINEDITKYMEFQNYLAEKNGLFLTMQETFRGDVSKMLDHLLEMAQLHIGKSTSRMTKEDKLNFINFLDQRGAFLITKSGSRVCDMLNISKFTLYNYLDIARKNKQFEAEDNES